MKLIDYVFIGLTLLLVIRCTLRGFISEFMTLASLVLGVLCSLFLYRNCAAFLRSRGLEAFTEKIPGFIQKLLPALVRNIPEILSFVLIFVLVFMLVKLVEYLLTDIVERINLGGVDRFLGFLFGFAEGIMAASLVLLAFTLQPVFDAGPLLEGSFFAEFLLPLIVRWKTPVEELRVAAQFLAGFTCLKIS
ncbi:MAG: CvpA family protein [Treponema sp.]|jgi:membrane protein required for colicin V production|nr:CvpA family protein [Treponema sp.]